MFVFLFSIAVISCGRMDNKQFTMIHSTQSGIEFVNEVLESDNANILDYLYFYNGAGLSVGDINNDSLPDLFFVANQQENRLYLNLGNLKFKDITEDAGVAGNSDWNTGSVMADVNGDGYLDIYVLAVVGLCGFEGRNELFINQGNGIFQEEAQRYGLDFESYSGSAAFLDFDKDGDLDLYLLNQAVHTSESHGSADLRYGYSYESGDKLLENLDGRYVDVSEKAGILGGPISYGLGLGIADFNNDGWDDIYVGNDFHENDYFYLNNRDGTFSEKLQDHFSMISRFSIGNDIADINGDGFMDIITVDLLPEEERYLKSSRGDGSLHLHRIHKKMGYHPQYMRNMLQINNGGKYFTEIALFGGVASTDWSWSPLFADLDQDGWLDLFISTGIHRRPNDLDYIQFISSTQIQNKLSLTNLVDKEVISSMPPGITHNYIFRGKGERFTDKSGEWMVPDTLKSSGAAYSDLDNDGDLDLIVNNFSIPPVIYRNNNPGNNPYLKIKLIYKGENPFGIGTRVLLYDNNHLQSRQLHCSRGFQSSVEPLIHFGLGARDVIDSLIILWPDNNYQILTNVTANQTLNINYIESRKEFDWERLAQKRDHWFAMPDTSKIIRASHVENPFEDFLREKLIPYTISADGPALATGDVNGDGLTDLFLGGSKNQSAQLFIQEESGFLLQETPGFESDKIMEDVDAQLFDVDSDGDLDLFVLTAGGEFYGKSRELMDRIYINDGNGIFTRNMLALPDYFENGSVVRPADFDGDGDLDLFVGGRAVSNAFGQIPNSYLLENDGQGIFSINRQPALKNAGMITDALWDDFSGDGKDDLILVGEWMAPKFYENVNGTFAKVTQDYLPGDLEGLWRTIETLDADGDGDMDYLLGNWGLNSKFTASEQFPLLLYYDDFNGDGKTETLIAISKKGKYYPLHNKDELDSQLDGMISRLFPSYSEFAGLTMDQVFGKEILDKASKLKVTTLASGYLRKDGDRFSFVPFAGDLQISPINCFLCSDINSDGIEDILSGANLRGIKPFHGLFVSNTGNILSQDGSLRTGLETGIDFGGKEIRHISRISVGEDDYLLATPNNDSLLWYRIK